MTLQEKNISLDPAKENLCSELYSAICAFATAKGEDEKNLLSKNELYELIETPPESHLGDFALPCFRFAKLFRQNPNAIAKHLSDALQNSSCSWFESSKVVGAFLNIFIDKSFLATHLMPKVLDDTFFVAAKNPDHAKEKVMIEFSQPNTHKEFHIGHSRNVCLGDSLCRIFTYNGFNVVPVNYIGDEGTHVAKCLWQVKEQAQVAPLEKASEWYGKRYADAHNMLSDADDKQKEVYQQKISEILASLESKEGEYFKLWQESRSACMQDFEGIYKWLDVHFDHIFYESEVSEESQSIVDTYIEKGLFTPSKGAYGIDMEDSGLGFFMARKSDGTSLYITKDLALAKRKFEDFSIDRSIYVVGSEQIFHFKQLFKALELMGFEQAKDCHHLSYAHVTLPEGKISSRKGNAISFSHLINVLGDEIAIHLEKYKDEWNEEEINDTAQKLIIAAIKYGMLSTDPQKEIVFDPKVWTSFDGNSGPYLLYSYARTRSILRSCSEKSFHKNLEHLSLLTEAHEHELLRQLYDFNTTVSHACESYKPSVIANYLFTICKSFNRFYANHSVLKAENDELRSARIALIEVFSLVLKKGLFLLGISPAERM